MSDLIAGLITYIFAAIVVAVTSFIIGIPLYFIWNEILVAAITGVNPITYIGAVCISFVVMLLFRG